MTSKLDTAGLVERLRDRIKFNGAIIKFDKWAYYDKSALDFDRKLFAALEALQERAERAERERDEAQEGLRLARVWDFPSDIQSLAVRLEAAEARVAWLTEALEVISGERPCVDNLMSNADVARAALHQQNGGKNA